LINLGYFEESATLAEHYKDFHMLILLCERTNDNEKLQQYKFQFKNEGFDNILYQWYVENGQWSQLMTTKDKFNDFDTLLSSNEQLSWIHFIGVKEYSKASQVLSNLATEEKESIARKKYMLVLANLTILAANEAENVMEAKISDIDGHLELLSYQCQFFKYIGKELSDDTLPLTAEELINLALDGNSPTLTKSQYISLIELLQFLSSNQQPYFLKIWSKCLLQDSWEEEIHLDATAVISHKIFYKCLKYWKEKSISVETLPRLKDLIPMISCLSENMLHHVKICYEMLSLQELSLDV